MPPKLGPLRPHEERQRYERRLPAEPPPGQPNPGDSFLIVTEGAVTEKLYFEGVRTTLRLSPVTVKVIHPGCTDAEGLVRAAMGFYEWDTKGRRIPKGTIGIRDVETYDHVWVLFDTDVPARQRQLQPALDLATKEKIHVGHSTPCVEIWLLLHFRDRPGPLLNADATRRAIEDALKQEYTKTKEAFPRLWESLRPNIPVAVARGAQIRDYHKKAETQFPPNPSTELDLLVRALDASVRDELRILRQF